MNSDCVSLFKVPSYFLSPFFCEKPFIIAYLVICSSFFWCPLTLFEEHGVQECGVKASPGVQQAAQC